MQKPLNITSSSPITSAPLGKASLSGVGKADAPEADALGGKFAGLLNHALNGPQSETPRASKPAALAKSGAAKTEEAESAASANPDLEKLAFKSAKGTGLGKPGLALTPKASSLADPVASEAEVTLPEDPTLSSTTPAETGAVPDPQTDKTNPESNPIGAQDLLALSVPLQPQPLNLAVLQAAFPLMTQPVAIPAQATGTPNASTTGLPAEVSAVNPAEMPTALSLPQAASQLTLLPLPQVPKGVPTFGMPNSKQEKTAPGSLTPATQPESLLQTAITEASQPLASTISSPALQIPATNAQSDAFISLSIASAAPATLPLAAPVSTEGAAGNGVPSLEGLSTSLASSIGPGAGIGKANSSSSSKPNASRPATEAFQNSLKSIQANLNAMQGSIENAPDSTDKSTKETDLANSALPEASSTLSASDLMTANGLSGAHQTQATTQGNGDQTRLDGVASFSSSAQNPTEQVAEGTAYSVKNGHRELIIRLNPDNLGEVRINLTSHGNQQLSARLIATTPESHELLKGQMDSLKTSLTAQGVNVDRISVVLAGSSESGNASHSNPDQPPQQQQHSQQGSFQQQYNQQNPSNTGMFSQMNGQQQQSLSQHLAQNQTGERADGPEATLEGLGSAHKQPATSHDNGRISILA
jgi:hypothetical protein